MRIKVVDMFSDGELECLTDDSQNDFLRVSRWNLLREIGLSNDLSNEEAFQALKDKEFHIHPIVDRIIPSYVKSCKDVRWTQHEIPCNWCGLRFCTCGDDYEPEATT